MVEKGSGKGVSQQFLTETSAPRNGEMPQYRLALSVRGDLPCDGTGDRWKITFADEKDQGLLPKTLVHACAVRQT